MYRLSCTHTAIQVVWNYPITALHRKFTTNHPRATSLRLQTVYCVLETYNMNNIKYNPCHTWFRSDATKKDVQIITFGDLYNCTVVENDKSGLHPIQLMYTNRCMITRNELGDQWYTVGINKMLNFDLSDIQSRHGDRVVGIMREIQGYLQEINKSDFRHTDRLVELNKELLSYLSSRD